VIAVGIYLTVEKVQFISWTMGTELVGASCYLIMSAASVIFLVSFIGCFGSLFKKRNILLVVRTSLRLPLLYFLNNNNNNNNNHNNNNALISILP